MTIDTHSQTGRELLAGLYTAIATADVAAAHALLAPDVVLHVPGTHPMAGDHEGRDAVLAFAAASSTLADRTEDVDIIDMLEGTAHAAALCLVTGRREGRVALVNRTVHLFRVEGQRLAEIWFHNWDQQATDAFWA